MSDPVEKGKEFFDEEVEVRPITSEGRLYEVQNKAILKCYGEFSDVVDSERCSESVDDETNKFLERMNSPDAEKLSDKEFLDNLKDVKI